MFFYLSKLFASLLFPYPLLLIAAALGIWRMPRGWLRRLCIAVWTGALLLSLNPIASALIRSLEDQYPHRSIAELLESPRVASSPEDASDADDSAQAKDQLENDSARPASPPFDAIIVLGGMVDPLTGHSTRPEFIGSVDRILAGRELLAADAAPRLVLSGGSGLVMQTGESEARILRRWLETTGVDPERILVEAGSRNTAENARETARIANERGWRRIVLVTSAFHMPRSMGCFRNAAPELRIEAFPVDYYRSDLFPGPEALFPAPSALQVSTLAFKEYVGIVAYWLRGYI